MSLPASIRGRLIDGPDSHSGLNLARAGRHEPIRTCIGCRGRDARASVLRVVAVAEDGQIRVVIDQSATMPGRGAWLHDRCVERAISRRAFARALRVSAPLDLSEVERFAQEMKAEAPSNVDLESGLEADGHPMSTQR